jgi:3-oxoacyl-[acyl-carrier-protein] synthase-1
VLLERPWRGLEKLVQMLRLAVEECIELGEPPEPMTLPLLLCLAEKERRGRPDGLEDRLLDDLPQRLGVEFHPGLSSVISFGRVSVAIALAKARTFVHERGVPRVLIAAVDSLLVGPTLAGFDAQGRLLTTRNSNGFVPGEAAGAVLVGRELDPGPGLRCVGLGFSEERATVAGDDPLRADGLTDAVRRALIDAGCELHDLDFRITDNSGEQYYFKEAALALTRILRVRKAEFDIWHPADCIGETGAASGVAALAVALSACRKTYSPGPGILLHAANDAGQRAAAVLRYGEAS